MNSNLYVINANDRLLRNFVGSVFYQDVYFTRAPNARITVTNDSTSFIEVTLEQAMASINQDCHVLLIKSSKSTDLKLLDRLSEVTTNIILVDTFPISLPENHYLALGNLGSDNIEFNYQLFDTHNCVDQSGSLLEQYYKLINTSDFAYIIRPLMKRISYPDESTFIFEVRSFWLHSNTGDYKPTGIMVGRNGDNGNLKIVPIRTNTDILSFMDSDLIPEAFCITVDALDIALLRASSSYYKKELDFSLNQSSLMEHHSSSQLFITRDYKKKDLIPTHSEYAQPVQQPVRQPVQQPVQQPNRIQQPSQQSLLRQIINK